MASRPTATSPNVNTHEQEMALEDQQDLRADGIIDPNHQNQQALHSGAAVPIQNIHETQYHSMDWLLRGVDPSTMPPQSAISNQSQMPMSQSSKMDQWAEINSFLPQRHDLPGLNNGPDHYAALGYSSSAAPVTYPVPGFQPAQQASTAPSQPGYGDSTNGSTHNPYARPEQGHMDPAHHDPHRPFPPSAGPSSYPATHQSHPGPSNQPTPRVYSDEELRHAILQQLPYMVGGTINNPLHPMHFVGEGYLLRNLGVPAPDDPSVFATLVRYAQTPKQANVDWRAHLLHFEQILKRLDAAEAMDLE